MFLPRHSAIVVLICLMGSAPPARSEPQHGAPVQVQMRNILYHFTGGIAVHIRRLDGRLLPTGSLPVFDDKQSFWIAIETAEIAITTDAMQHVLNDYVFAARDAPLKNLVVSTEGMRLKIKGKLHSKGDVAFEISGNLTATSEGKIRLHAEKVRALHLPVKGLMDLLGVEIKDLVKSSQLRGVAVEGDDVILDPAQLLPAPHIQGRVSNVRLEGRNIVQVFGPAATPRRWFHGNYMGYRGAALRFGKLTMNDTDMFLIDMDPRDPFDFYLDHYREQLTAGYTKTTPQFGLRVYMRDYDKLHPAPRR